MKRLNHLSEQAFLKLFFLFFSSSFIVAAFFMYDREHMFTGLLHILRSTTKASTNFFAIGGYGATFLNMGLVGLACTLLCCLPGCRPGPVSTLALILTVGFSSWGIHILNMWPTMLGVALHALVKKNRLGEYVNAMMFSTGVAPFISELMVRYPHALPVGFQAGGILLALLVGAFVGFFLPTGLKHSPMVHKGV